MKTQWYSSSKHAYQVDKDKPNAKQWYNKNGTCKAYAFACGAMETYLAEKDDDEFYISLKQSNGFYEVTWLFGNRSSHHHMVFDRLSSARTHVNALKRSPLVAD